MEALAWEQFYNKTFVVLLTYRHHYESAAAFFERIAPHFNISLHLLSCCTYDKTRENDILPVKSIRESYDLGVNLGRQNH
jgi:hypothetical protein